MVSKPKLCKYGCGTTITWHDTGRFFLGPDGQKHDCRDWPGVGGNDGVSSGQGFVQSPQQSSYSSAPPPNGETLIGVQAKKTWENYFKMLEPLTANSAAMVAAVEETNKHLVHIGAAIKSLEDALTVIKIRSSNDQKKEVVGEEDGA